MLTIYRMCDIPSTNTSPIYQEHKYALNSLCLKSFVHAFADVKPEMHFLCDYCPEEYKEMISLIVPKSWNVEIEFTNIGINETMMRSYEIARDENDIVLFNECDHLWRDRIGTKTVEAIERFKLFSPYDHPDFYSRYDIQLKETEIILFNNSHYRKSNRNVMTFGMTHEALIENYSILRKYGYLDGDVWTDMRNNGFQLWTPILSHDTHMVRDYLAPGIEWESVWNKLT